MIDPNTPNRVAAEYEARMAAANARAEGILQVMTESLRLAREERDRWRALATEARPYVDTSPDWLDRFDAEAKGSP